jgi:hypothetical protein
VALDGGAQPGCDGAAPLLVVEVGGVARDEHPLDALGDRGVELVVPEGVEPVGPHRGGQPDGQLLGESRECPPVGEVVATLVVDGDGVDGEFGGPRDVALGGLERRRVDTRLRQQSLAGQHRSSASRISRVSLRRCRNATHRLCDHVPAP